jgi:hypothetical protein
VDLKGKLALLRDAGPGSRPPAPAPVTSTSTSTTPPLDDERRARLDRLRGLIGTVMSRQPTPAPAESTQLRVGPRSLPGGPRDTPHGPVHVAEEHLEPAHCQGRTPVASALEVTAETFSRLALDPGLARADPRGMLFLDTETTGLVGGTGTVPFLVGMAWFEDESLRVEQLFLRQLGQERPMLHVLTERLRAATLLVTYNGKTFDWPLLRTRFVMNRLEAPEPPPHLDLLHCSRRVYRRRLGECRLVHVEAGVLGLRRAHDVEGEEIPLRYLDYLRSGDESQLVPVIEHNAHDIISLAAVAGRLGTHYQRAVPSDDPEDHLSYALVAERAGDEERALGFARTAAEGGGSDAVTLDARLLLARLARFRDDVEGQERALAGALEAAAGARAAAVHLAISKLCEHSLKDTARALHHAELAHGAEPPETHARRLARLQKRLSTPSRRRARA